MTQHETGFGISTKYGRRDRFFFTEADDRIILDGWNDGSTNRQIADRIGRDCSDDNVNNRIAAFRRANIIHPKAIRPRPEKTLDMEKFNRSKRSATTGMHKSEHRKPRYAERSNAACPEPALIDGARVTLLTVKDGMCRWPHGDPGTPEFHLCGVSTGGDLYCIFHTRRAHAPRNAATEAEEC